MSEKKELKQEELDNVNGGYAYTYMRCTSCGKTDTWVGDEFVGQTYACPKCGENTYTGQYATNNNPYKRIGKEGKYLF